MTFLLATIVAGVVLLARQDGRADRGPVILPLPPPDTGRLTPAVEREIRRRLDDLSREVGEIRATVAALTRARAETAGTPFRPLVAPEPDEGPLPVTLGVTTRPAAPVRAER